RCFIDRSAAVVEGSRRLLGCRPEAALPAVAVGIEIRAAGTDAGKAALVDELACGGAADRVRRAGRGGRPRRDGERVRRGRDVQSARLLERGLDLAEGGRGRAREAP